jgi:aspartyl aminopeptidase
MLSARSFSQLVTNIYLSDKNGTLKLGASPFFHYTVNTAYSCFVSCVTPYHSTALSWRTICVYRYFFTRNMSSVVAFAVGKKYEPGNGVYMVGAHTDSPCLKVKPVSKNTKSGFDMVNIETYGGGLFNTWFDRDLSVAGRVLIRGSGGNLEHKLV